MKNNDKPAALEARWSSFSAAAVCISVCEAFKKYQNDMPQGLSKECSVTCLSSGREGLARFDIHDPVTFEGPKFCPELGLADLRTASLTLNWTQFAAMG